jgi:hypothetical protein
MTTLPVTSRTGALALSTDLAQAGVVFNDATRLLDGGLWAKPADNNNQAAYLGMFTTDIQPCWTTSTRLLPIKAP